MKVQNLILGVMAFVLFASVTIVITLDMYSSEGFDINLSNNSYTNELYTLQTEMETQKAEITSHNAILQQNMPGQNGTDIPEGDIDQGTLIKSTFVSVTKIPNYLDVFITMIRTGLNAVGLGGGLFFWFFTGGLTVIVALLLLSSFWWRQL